MAMLYIPSSLNSKTVMFCLKTIIFNKNECIKLKAEIIYGAFFSHKKSVNINTTL